MARKILITLGIVLGVVVLVAILAPLLVPREKIRTIAAERLREATGGEVSLGEVSLKVLPRLKLVLGPSRVAVAAAGLRAAGNEPGPLVEAEVTMENLELDLALWPLLSKELEFGTVRLVQPEATVVTAPPDTTPAAGPAPPQGGQAGEATGAWGLALATVAVSDGQLLWREQGTGREVTVAGWQQEMSAPEMGVLLARVQRLYQGEGGRVADEPDGPVSLELATRIERLELAGFGESPPPPLTSLKLTGTLTAPPEADHLGFRIDELSAEGGLRATATGRTTPEWIRCEELSLAMGEAGALEGDLEATLPPATGPLVCRLAGRVDLGALPAALAPWLPSPQEPLPELSGGLDVQVAVDLDPAPVLSEPAAWEDAIWAGRLEEGQAEITAKGKDLRVSSPSLGEPLQIAELDYQGRLNQPGLPQRLVLGGLQHPGIQGGAEVTVRLGRGDAPHAAIVHVHELDLDAWTRIAQQQQASGGWSLVPVAYAQPAGAPAPGELIPADLHASLDARADRAVLLKTPYTGVRLQGTLDNRLIKVTELSAQLGDGRISGTGTVDYATDPRGVLSYEVDVEQAPPGLLLAPYLPAIASLWQGTLSAQADGGFTMGETETMLQTLSVDGILRSAGGEIDLTEALAGARQYLGDRVDLLKVDYSRFSQDFTIADGKVVVRNLEIDGKQTDWTGSGWLGLDGKLDLDLHVKLPPGFTPELGDLSFVADALRDQDGRIGLDFTLTGPQTAPKIALDIDPQELMKNSEVKDKLEDEVKKGLGGLLDKLKGKK